MQAREGMLAGADGRVGELLTWCARRLVSQISAAGAGDDECGAELPSNVDPDNKEFWSDFLREASRHMVMPLAWRALEPCRERIPELLARDLSASFDQNVARNLWLTAELGAMLRRLSEAGVEAVPWKGPLLAQRAYGELGLRQFFDLDVLVRTDDLDTAVRVAERSGLVHEKAMTHAQRETYVDHQGEVELVRESDGLWLELHTQIVPTYYASGTTSDELWGATRPETVGRVTVRGLAPVDELEALCVHGSKHRWDRLAWIVDIALMARLIDDSGWLRLMTAARSHGTRRMVSLGLLLAMDVAGARLPTRIAGAARADRTAGRLSEEVQRNLFDPQPHRLDSLIFHARMRERSSDQFRYLFNVLFTPSGADWESLALPRALFPLYALTRPVRLAFKYGQRLIVGD